MKRIPHDQRVALTNKTFREKVVPVLPDGEGAILIVFETGIPNGLMCYIASADRAGCRDMLRNLLAKWDADEAAGAFGRNGP